ncbi:MAG: hypothetical protein ACXAEN_27215 [Candidatus Thorarchaeota archaeon]
MTKTRIIDKLTREAHHLLWKARKTTDPESRMSLKRKANELIREARDECMKKGIYPLFLTEVPIE